MEEKVFKTTDTEEAYQRTQTEEFVENLTDFVLQQQLYRAAIKEMRTKLEILDEAFQVRYDHNPIHHIEYRLKSPKSIFGKLRKKGLPITTESIWENLTDVAGVRVICNYIDDVYRVAELLLKQDDITLVRVRNYIDYPKENGYRSLHLIVSVPIFLAEKTEHVNVEVQIRTIAMDFWASLEHQLKYKAQDDVSQELRKRLKNCADSIAALDIEMQSIHKELQNARSKPDENDVLPDPEGIGETKTASGT